MKIKTHRIVSSSEPSNIYQTATGKEISKGVWKEVPTEVGEAPGEPSVLKDKTLFQILLTGQVRYLGEMPAG